MSWRHGRLVGVAPVVMFAGWCACAHWILTGSAGGDPWATGAWAVGVAFMTAQIALSWFQRPYVTTRGQDAGLARLWVSVVVPCYNEDPVILDRVLSAISQQTRLPQHVIVVDDGSDPERCDYTEIRDWWQEHMPEGTAFTWIRQDNAGKKHAQAAAWRAGWDADVYVTIDSDSALARNAIEEGLKPFADEEIVASAGLETAWNYGRNLLTRAIAARSLTFQLTSMSGQSVAGGSVLICPGAFTIYRGWLIRKVMPAYLGETFLGVPVTLGDDTALTTFALTFGKVVHQPTAVAMNVYPETVPHHLKQWTRWMRASTIRTFWRLRYLPLSCYGWWLTAWQQCAFLASVAVTIAIPLGWPATSHLAVAIGLLLVSSPLALAARLGKLKRSDQTCAQKLAGVALLPVAALWFLLVLRQIRFWGMATCYRQSWVTRVNGAEVFASEREKVAA